MNIEWTPTVDQAIAIIEDYENCQDQCELCAARVWTNHAILRCHYTAKRAREILAKEGKK